jgi:[acyl-carrier-protein] S-malonyltransferase
VNAEEHGDPASIRQLLEQQVTHAVLWQRSMERLIEQGFDRFVEVGSGRVLAGLMRKINRKMNMVTVGTTDQLGVELVAASG